MAKSTQTEFNCFSTVWCCWILISEIRLFDYEDVKKKVSRLFETRGGGKGLHIHFASRVCTTTRLLYKFDQDKNFSSLLMSLPLMLGFCCGFIQGHGSIEFSW